MLPSNVNSASGVFLSLCSVDQVYIGSQMVLEEMPLVLKKCWDVTSVVSAGLDEWETVFNFVFAEFAEILLQSKKHVYRPNWDSLWGIRVNEWSLVAVSWWQVVADPRLCWMDGWRYCLENTHPPWTSYIWVSCWRFIINILFCRIIIYHL